MPTPKGSSYSIGIQSLGIDVICAAKRLVRFLNSKPTPQIATA